MPLPSISDGAHPPHFVRDLPETTSRVLGNKENAKDTFAMADLQGRKIFKVFNQDFIVDERYTVTKELGQGAYGIVWYALHFFSQQPPASRIRRSVVLFGLPSHHD